MHVRHRHRERFTVVGNHLAQHRELSLLAIGLGVHIQSVPDGTHVDIKSLTARFPEGEARVAAALRELEAYGYLTRTPQRTPGPVPGFQECPDCERPSALPAPPRGPARVRETDTGRGRPLP
ncbi:hypothetical protein [Streptomyces sp. AA1529]|uniref:hypothetical protein n=1 Tax=Streptomyces sp. AA1529 TaxID=1203257 RepID=UPI0002DF6158